MKIIDITDQVDFNLNDDELLPLVKCACGAEFESWTVILGVYEDNPTECPECKRKLFFNVKVCVFQIEDPK